MKLESVLIFLIFNSILWSLINSVKNNKNQSELKGVEENVAGSSTYPLIQKYDPSLKPKSKIAKTERNNLTEIKLKKKEYNRNYYKINREKIREQRQNVYKNSKEILIEKSKKYYEKNKEKIREKRKNYYENNKDKCYDEKKREYLRNYYLRKKNEKEILQKNSSIQSDSKEGNSADNAQINICENKGKEPILSRKDEQLDQKTFNQINIGHNIQREDDLNDLEDLNYFEDLKFIDDFDF
ncbi:unnamed protein product [Meloidogyne enterolobii]|uniref:Uncharacterized protein n=1 Tax=Meloidogyne enterolobii TaxID=390850 RepID=A0ACB0YEV4_MELEN